jgi:hypothetical protein
VNGWTVVERGGRILALHEHSMGNIRIQSFHAELQEDEQTRKRFLFRAEHKISSGRDLRNSRAVRRLARFVVSLI